MAIPDKIFSSRNFWVNPQKNIHKTPSDLLDFITFIASDCLFLGVTQDHHHLHTDEDTETSAVAPSATSVSGQRTSLSNRLESGSPLSFLETQPGSTLDQSLCLVAGPIYFPIISVSHVGKLAFYFKKILLLT